MMGLIDSFFNLGFDGIKANLEQKKEKNMEKYKTELSQKQYVNQVRFDTEFEIYRTLSKEFNTVVKNISILIPFGFSVPSSDEKNTFEDAENAFVAAQDVLYANGAFISKELYNKYDDILKLCDKQLNAFRLCYSTSHDTKIIFTDEQYERTKIIGEKWVELNNSVREYISNLEVID